ncbi:hypothetical protein Scep_027203 [Stephania cephalantha]|uniref:Uncharacterized protein n=1 Tax=Stephania cephalantha TaxID=152367 RepID=A0AAP0E7R2_9MAGN
MEPLVSVVDTLKSFATSSEDFLKGIFHASPRQNPIEIMKRLQREAFSDIMKLRDRQDKVERLLSFYRSTKGGPFQEDKTHLYGVIDMAGALLFANNFDHQTQEVVSRAGVRTGIDARFTFETNMRQKDVLSAELIACQNEKAHSDGVFGPALSLSKVMYLANINEWCSGVFIPWGGQCKDVVADSNPLQKERVLFDPITCRPPMLSRSLGSGAGFMMRRSGFAASLAGFIDRVEMHPSSVEVCNCFNAVGQVICHISKRTRLAVMGVRKKVIPPSQQCKPQQFILPLGGWRHSKSPSDETTSLISEDLHGESVDHSVAVTLESELDECTRIKGWIEMHNLNPRIVQWALTLSDTPQDELGWGLRLGGIIHGSSTLDQFQAEAFVNLNVSKRFDLQSGILYMTDGNAHIPALMFRSSWSL